MSASRRRRRGIEAEIMILYHTGQMITPAGRCGKARRQTALCSSDFTDIISGMKWIFLSPHLDDVAFSCGGLVWELTHNGDSVAIWTICAADPPLESISPYAGSLHTRWAAGSDAVALRREEDARACQILGAVPHYLSFLDAIYRRSPIDGNPLYISDDDLFGKLHPQEYDLVDALQRELEDALPAEVELCCPLTIGGHVDHRLVRMAAERLDHPLWYYADYPYVALSADSLNALTKGMTSERFPISAEGLAAWEAAAAAHVSQISTFWQDAATMQAALRAYCLQQGGIRLWR